MAVSGSQLTRVGASISGTGIKLNILAKIGFLPSSVTWVLVESADNSMIIEQSDKTAIVEHHLN